MSTNRDMNTNTSKYRGVCPAWWTVTPGMVDAPTWKTLGQVAARWSTVSRVGPVVPVCDRDGGTPGVVVIDPARVRDASNGLAVRVVSTVIPAEFADEVRELVAAWDRERARGAVWEALYGDMDAAERWAEDIYVHYEGEPAPEAWAGYLSGELDATRGSAFYDPPGEVMAPTPPGPQAPPAHGGTVPTAEDVPRSRTSA